MMLEKCRYTLALVDFYSREFTSVFRELTSAINFNFIKRNLGDQAKTHCGQTFTSNTLKIH